jgi:hypothetical protein
MQARDAVGEMVKVTGENEQHNRYWMSEFFSSRLAVDL